MKGYSPIEAAVVQQFLNHFPDELNANRCKAADIDGVFLAIKGEDADFGCVLDYGDGRFQTNRTFNTEVWTWQIIGFFLVRYRGDVVEHDLKARQVIDKLASLFSQDHRLGGMVPLININEISQPEPFTLNEVPFYYIAFSINAIDK